MPHIAKEMETLPSWHCLSVSLAHPNSSVLSPGYQRLIVGDWYSPSKSEVLQKGKQTRSLSGLRVPILPDAVPIPTLAEQLLSARLKHYTLGQVTWQRKKQDISTGASATGDNSATKV